MFKLVLLALIVVIQAIPDGRYVLINGHIGSGEWDSSLTVPLDDKTELRLKKDRSSLFLAVVFKGPHHTGVDLYLKSAGRTRMLHVSSALGEKELRSGEWSEMNWGRNTWWTANTVGLINEQGKARPLAPDAFEFQISRQEIGRNIDLYLELKRPDKRLPSAASPDSADQWLHVKLG
jgi:hypothetical protein